MEDEQTFLVDEAIQFKRVTEGDITSFTWVDVSEVSNGA